MISYTANEALMAINFHLKYSDELDIAINNKRL